MTPAVIRETDAALKAHGLIKVRVLGDDRAARDTIYQTLCDELGAAPIQHIGKLLVLWRPIPEKIKAVDEERMPGPRDVKVLKFSKRGGQKPGRPSPPELRSDTARHGHADARVVADAA